MSFAPKFLCAGFSLVSALPVMAQTMTDVSPQTPPLYGLEGSMIQMAHACNINGDVVRDSLFYAPRELCVAATQDIVSRARRQFLSSVGNDSEENPGTTTYGVVSVPMVNGKPAEYADGAFVDADVGTYTIETKSHGNNNLWHAYQAGFDRPCDAVESYGSKRDTGVQGFVEFVYAARACIDGISRSYALIHSEDHDRVVSKGYRKQDITGFMADAAIVLDRIPLSVNVAFEYKRN